jgi:hypothetical protein
MDEPMATFTAKPEQRDDVEKNHDGRAAIPLI